MILPTPHYPEEKRRFDKVTEAHPATLHRFEMAALLGLRFHDSIFAAPNRRSQVGPRAKRIPEVTFALHRRYIAAMAIPPELKYEDEDDFVQRFLIPLIQRLGFSVVANYHGTSELGKDLIFAEVDRFGHVRYHGLQAKYEDSISVNKVEELVLDCKQAFNNPFKHPQTGTIERISTFYAVNAGTLGSQAVENYFNALLPLYGGNARLLQAKDLLVLDRWATASRRERIIDLLAGLRIELDYNQRMVADAIRLETDSWSDPEKTKQKVYPPNFRFRTDATSDYLRQPFLTEQLNVDWILTYWHRATLANKLFDVASLAMNKDRVMALWLEAITQMRTAEAVGKKIRGLVESASRSLESIAPIAPSARE